ncbi:MAG: hypothetical protein J6R79_04120 [Bacteroidaceae bacterium]|nr:hypothetical protein [Bacteroidaceae bacterium]
MIKIKYFLLFLLIFASVTACVEDENFVITQQSCLTFSTDTVDFDTIIAGAPSVTKSFWIYNQENKNIVIPKVKLLNADSSVFRLNIDGEYMANADFSSIEIRSKDSLCVFVDAFPPQTESCNPINIADKIIFTLNEGVEQHVELVVQSQSVNTITKLIIETDTVLKANRPYHVKDTLLVMPQATLTLESGVQMLFQQHAVFEVRGKLIARGNLENQIVFRGDRMDDMFENQPYDRVSGQWSGVHFTSMSYGNVLQYVDIHSARTAILCDSSNTDEVKLLVEHSTVHNNSQDGLCLIYSKTRVGNSQISNAGGNCVTIIGGKHDFVHTTIAQFYPFSAQRGVALYFTNYYNEIRYPLHALQFSNCIITGYGNDEIMGTSSDRYQDDLFNFTFDHCLLNTPSVTHESFVNCLWDDGKDGYPHKQDNFYPPFSQDSLIYTFGLNKTSKAVDAANVKITQTTYPADRLGILRDVDKPDMGCYELQSSE